MYSSRMRTACSLTVSHCILHMPPPTIMHTPLQPCTPSCNHACPPQPCMPPHNHACPPQPRMPYHNHTCPPATTHAPHNHTCPPATTHASPQPCMPPTTTHAPLATTHALLRQPVNRMTNRCKNITLPQTSFAGGNKK